MKSKLRIISGAWRSRQLVFENTPGLRPTPDRIRETLFNWLQHDVLDSVCLDLFAGSGSLGFEAASRGAKSVVLVEKNRLACQLIKENLDKLSAKQIEILHMDVFNFLEGAVAQYNLVFLDPPFSKGWAQETCHRLEDSGWLTSSAKVYIEVESQLALDDIPVNWKCLKSKKSGEVGCYLYERRSSKERGFRTPE